VSRAERFLESFQELPPRRAFLVTLCVGGLVIGALVAALLPSAGVLADAHDYRARVPPLRALAQRSTIYDRDGAQIAQVGTINREDVPLASVPKLIRRAVIAVEDKTFWTNDGIDLNALVRAAVENFNEGRIEQGGSTITQQLVKNRILSNARDLDRKVREVLFALRLDKKYSKREILEQYLNTVYFGQGSYGVQSAVERFFVTADPGAAFPRSKRLDEVTLGEAALLAGLISNPEGNNPFTDPDGARRRRTVGLESMVAQGYVSRAAADAAEQEALPSIKPQAELRPRNSWAEEVQDRLFNDDVYRVLGKTPEEREQRVLTGGLKIYSTLDPNLQQLAQTAMDEILPEKPGFTGALVAMEPATGQVKAMVAGPGFEASQYNIATSYPGRQSGSTWKVITLAAALESGFSPKDTVSGGSPCVFKEWGRTQNAEGGSGTMSLRSATANSVNCAFARTELAVGFPKVIETAHALGITQETLEPVLTLTLGAVESTPVEMATVTSTIANGGVHHPPVFVSKIVTSTGDVIFDATKDVEGKQVISADTAACEADMLRGVITGGTGTAARLAGNRPVAGKTGTTDNKTDANFLGFTPQLATFVWHGNALARVPGAGFGGQVPARIFKKFMDSALFGQPVVDFPAPGPACDRLGASISENGRGVPGRSTGPRPEVTVIPEPTVIVTPEPTVVTPEPAPLPEPAPPEPSLP
jgi:penicillin-binding protein 1A